MFPGPDGVFHEAVRRFPYRRQASGRPVIYSPRVIFYNPELFRKAGAPLPFSGWSWDDFLESVRRLKKSVPPDRILACFPKGAS